MIKGDNGLTHYPRGDAFMLHHDDIHIHMSVMASQITSNSTVCFNSLFRKQQSEHQSSFPVSGLPVMSDSPHKGPNNV